MPAVLEVLAVLKARTSITAVLVALIVLLLIRQLVYTDRHTWYMESSPNVACFLER